MYIFTEEYDFCFTNFNSGWKWGRRLEDSADVALQQLHVASTGIPLKLSSASVSLLTVG